MEIYYDVRPENDDSTTRNSPVGWLAASFLTFSGSEACVHT